MILAAALRYRYSHNTYAVELDDRAIGHIEMHGASTTMGDVS